jgi:hypothetical protein
VPTCVLGAQASVDFLLYWRPLASDPISEPTARADVSVRPEAGAFELYNNKGSLSRLPRILGLCPFIALNYEPGVIGNKQ